MKEVVCLQKKKEGKRKHGVVYVARCGCFAEFDLLRGIEAYVLADVVVSLTRFAILSCFDVGCTWVNVEPDSGSLDTLAQSSRYN